MNDTVVEAYEKFRAMGTVLDVARFSPPPPGAASQAVVLAMRVFAQRYHDRLVALNPGRNVSGYFHVRIDDAVDSGRRVLVGERISFAELLGPGYDLDADEIRLFRYSPGNAVSLVHEGLARALLDPPYGLRDPKRIALGQFGTPEYAAREAAWMRDILRAFCAKVLELDSLEQTSHLRIHRWPTDWSNYFDAGKEWWGAFLWTIEDTRNDWVTVIGASATD